MKLSEAMELLEGEPTLEFRLVEKYKTWTLKTDHDPRYGKDVALFFILECEGEDSMGGAGEFSGNLLVNDDRWEHVKQPLTWREAIQEFAKGKKVIINFNNQEWDFESLILLPSYLDVAITNGEWHVEN